MVAAICAHAYDFVANDIYYNVVSSTGKTCEVVFGNKKYTGDIVIPNKVTYNNETFTVASIGQRAFQHCLHLTSITILNSITKIDRIAFWNCN